MRLGDFAVTERESAECFADPFPHVALEVREVIRQESFARGHGDINLTANTVSGIPCQVDRVRHQRDRLISMTVERHLVYHSHYAVTWGVPGNIMKIIVRVRSSTDPGCEVGTVGHVTLFSSYNDVRSDGVQFSFPAACRDHDHLYHGPRSINQVPPL